MGGTCIFLNNSASRPTGLESDLWEPQRRKAMAKIVAKVEMVMGMMTMRGRIDSRSSETKVLAMMVTRAIKSKTQKEILRADVITPPKSLM